MTIFGFNITTTHAILIGAIVLFCGLLAVAGAIAAPRGSRLDDEREIERWRDRGTPWEST